MSALGQKRTLPVLFDHLVGARKYCCRNCETKGFRGLEIDHHFVFGRGLDWKVSCLFALEDAIDIVGRAPEWVHRIWAVGDQATAGRKIAEIINSGQPVLRCQSYDQFSVPNRRGT